MSILSKSILTILFSGILFSHAYAQTNEAFLRASPEFVRPNSSVTIIAEGSSNNFNVGTFTWYVDGKVFSKGRGMTSITIPSGKNGATKRVSVDISTSDGPISKSITLRPTDVSLVWKADSYVPPFYKGGRLSTYESEFSVTAIPDFLNTSGTRIDPKTLVYTWNKNGTIDPEQSGYGKDTYKGRQSSFTRGEDQISVIVSTVNDELYSGQSIIIEPRVPETLFYENNPLYGVIYEKALVNSFFLTGEELTIRAISFDLSIPKNQSDVTLSWTINGFVVPDFNNKNEIVLRKTGSESGQNIIGVAVQNQNKLLQGSQNTLTILQ